MKKVFISIWQWLFGNKKGVEVTAPLETPTMKIVKPEPQEDKVEAILSGNAPEPQFMDIEESSDMLHQEEAIQEKDSYKPLKFNVVKGEKTFSLTEKQYFFYITIAKNDMIKGVNICKAYLAFRHPMGIPKKLPRWHYDLYTHRNTIGYLKKIGLIKKVGKKYTIN